MSTIEQLRVELGDRSYTISIGRQILNNPEYYRPALGSSQVAIVTNDTIAKWYLEPVTEVVNRALDHAQIKTVILPDGEQFKNLNTLEQIFTGLLEAGFNRKATIIALGGGVIGDMAGFAAACYQRGIAFLQIPTTLLAQVDSSVGGKTGVNHALGKNMIGAFYQPRAVIIDTDVLSTLADRELSAGLAEVIKYGLIADAEFLDWLEQNIEALKARDTAALTKAILRSCQIKADVVAKDETEAGLRAILNLGHTYGHAIETEMGYGNWLHGEAVAAGMVMACELSARLGWIPEALVKRAAALLQRADLPIAPPQQMKAEAFLKHMKVDKKNVDGTIRLVLLRGCGEAITTGNYDRTIFERQLAEL